MTQKELNERIAQHKLWLDTDGLEGSRLVAFFANLRCAELSGADLLYVDIHNADLRGADLSGSDLRGADLHGTDLSEADIRHADLCGADLSGADLRGANIDHSCWSLDCDSLGVNVDTRIARQLAYHFCRLHCDDPEYIRAKNAIVDFANGFHRLKGCGKLDKKEV